MKYDVTALGELLIDLTQNGMSEQGNPILEANPGGAPCNVLALLAAYMHRKEAGQSMEDYLMNKVFSTAKSVTVQPDPAGVAGFEIYLTRYKAALAAEKAAAQMN